MRRRDKAFHITPILIGGLALVGVVALLLNALFGHSRIAFDLIAFTTGIIALVMGTFQSALITHQMRIIERSNDKLNETIRTIDDLVRADKKIARQVNEDAEFEQRIIRTLSTDKREQ